MCLAIFPPLKTNNYDCKQKKTKDKVDNRWKNELKTFHGLFYITSNLFSEGLKDFHDFIVYTVRM